MNRLLISPDDYKGYTITTCTTTPDGSLFTDVLADLGVTSIRMDATAGKYSGSTVVDFPPRSVLSMRLVLQNQVDGTTIPLRSLSLTQRSYQAGATTAPRRPPPPARFCSRWIRTSSGPMCRSTVVPSWPAHIFSARAGDRRPPDLPVPGGDRSEVRAGPSLKPGSPGFSAARSRQERWPDRSGFRAMSGGRRKETRLCPSGSVILEEECFLFRIRKGFLVARTFSFGAGPFRFGPQEGGPRSRAPPCHRAAPAQDLESACSC